MYNTSYCHFKQNQKTRSDMVDPVVDGPFLFVIVPGAAVGKGFVADITEIGGLVGPARRALRRRRRRRPIPRRSIRRRPASRSPCTAACPPT